MTNWIAELLKQLQQSTQRIVLSGLILLSILLLLLSKLDVRMVQNASDTLSDGGLPLIRLVAGPITLVEGWAHKVGSMLAVYEENQRLREENARLLAWKARAVRLEVNNRFLSEAVDLPVGEPITRSTTARVVADGAAGFLHSRLIDAGIERGVVRGMAAVDAHGLVGRIVQAGHRSSRLLLLTDFSSRIPVMVGNDGEQAILEGDGSDRPRLNFLPINPRFEHGDRVITSGTGGLLPPGLPVGTVMLGGDGHPRVQPYVDWPRLNLVSVVHTPAVLPPEASLVALEGPG